MLSGNVDCAFYTRLYGMAKCRWRDQETPHAALIVPTAEDIFLKFMFLDKNSTWINIPCCDVSQMLCDVKYALRKNFHGIQLLISSKKDVTKETKIKSIRILQKKNMNKDQPPPRNMEPKKQNQSEDNCCAECGKKLKLSTTRSCKCQLSFCAQHIHCHECKFDYQKHHQDFIRKQLKQ